MEDKKNSDIVAEQLETILNNDYYDADAEYRKNIASYVAELKAACTRAKIPMYVCLAVKNTEKETTYVNDCVLASLEQPIKGNRIAKLLLACKGADTNYPEYIKKDIQELTEYLDHLNRKGILDDSLGIKLTEDKIPDYLAIGEGLVTASPPQVLLNNGLPFNEDFDDLEDFDE